ncbi:MAG: hypothetical protein V1697_00945 [Candidatus Levyibacteriota bacterium]
MFIEGKPSMPKETGQFSSGIPEAALKSEVAKADQPYTGRQRLDYAVGIGNDVVMSEDGSEKNGSVIPEERQKAFRDNHGIAIGSSKGASEKYRDELLKSIKPKPNETKGK